MTRTFIVTGSELVEKARRAICPACGGDGKETCNNPDHEFMAAMPGEVGRLGCPVCGSDPKHKIPNGGNCEGCNGTGNVLLTQWVKVAEWCGYYDYPAHISLARYTINPSDWNQGEEVKEGEFEAWYEVLVMSKWVRCSDKIYNQASSKLRRLFAIPKRKEKDNLKWEQEIWDAARDHNYPVGTIIGVGNGYKWTTLREWLNSKVAKNI